MNRDPIVLINEFLQREEPHLRKNAVVALGAITSSERTDRLVHLALNDAEPQIRECAEKELVNVWRGGETRLLDIYEESRNDRPKRKLLYALLGRLRSKGADVPRRRAGVRAALSLFSVAYPTRGWKFYFRPLLPALGGVVVSSILFAVVLGAVALVNQLSSGLHEDLVFNIVFAAAVAVVGAVVASARTTAYALHYSSRLAFLIEVLFPSLIVTAAYTIGVLLYKLATGNGHLSGIVLGGVLIFATVAASRAFTMVAAGTAKSRIGNFFAAAVTGTIGAILVCTGIAALYTHDSASMAWSWILPACGGLSAAFASIDSRVPTTDRSRARLILSRSLMVLGAIAALDFLVAIFLLRPQARIEKKTQTPPAMIIASPEGVSRFPVKALPFRAQINVRESSVLYAEWGQAVRGTLVGPGDKLIFATSFSQRELLAPGTYRFELTRFASSELSPDEALDTTLKVLAVPFRGGRPLRSEEKIEKLSEPLFLSVGFNQPGLNTTTSGVSSIEKTRAQARISAGRKYAQEGRITEAFTEFREARRKDPNLAIPAEAWYDLCWNAAIRNHAAEVVNDACESAVALAPGNAQYLEARGVAKALTGRAGDAVDDFVPPTSFGTDKHKEMRPGWIESLRAGKNPFTPEVLRLLVEETMKAKPTV
jgi:hypothetical protein